MIVAIRPEPGASATVAAGRELGLEIHALPLFEVRSLPWALPDEPIDGLLIGSANVFRHGGKGLAALRDKPAYVVGEATAAAAREAGFEVTAIGEGGLQKVLDRIEAPLRLLRLAGEERVPLTPPPGVEIVVREAYRVEALIMPQEAAETLRHGAVVLLHSAAAARHFASACDRLDVPRERLRLAALAPRIAEAAGPGWREVAVASHPHEAALVALAGELCQERGSQAEER